MSSKERPILFSAPMVRSILAGTKTQTRRVMKPQPEPYLGGIAERKGGHVWPSKDHTGPWAGLAGSACPYGHPGDRLWVRETWAYWPLVEDHDPKDGVTYRATDEDEWECRMFNWRPSIHMPRWASRITLEITDVRVERLRDISVSDAIAEGYDGSIDDPVDPSIKWYSRLWESINAPGSWEANPWVWAISFHLIEDQR